MASSVANAQHLQKVELDLRDINFLQPCLSSLSHSQSLQELDVWCDASGVFSGCAHTCIHSLTLFFSMSPIIIRREPSAEDWTKKERKKQENMRTETER